MIKNLDFTKTINDARSLALSNSGSGQSLESTILILCNCIEIMQLHNEIKELSAH